MTNNVQVMLHGIHYKSKPKNAGYIQNNIKQVSITLERLADELSHGASFKPALLSGKSNNTWISQQVFALDFDHGDTIEATLDRCKALDILPVFGYTSFSHTPQAHRFRLVFCTPEPITSAAIRRALNGALIAAFPGVDQITKDPARLFYGGQGLIYAGYNNRIDPQGIVERYGQGSEVRAQNEHKPKKPAPHTESIAKDNIKNDSYLHIRAISTLNVDLLRFLIFGGDKQYSDKEDNISYISLYRISPQPIVCRSQMELYYTINHLDLKAFTGIYDKVSCILPGHEDSTPSAHIYETDDGTPIYKCFGCNRSRTIISLVEEIAHCSRSRAIKFIKDVYNIQFEFTDKIKEQQQRMIDSANFLDTAEFKIAFPALSNLIRTRKHHIQKLLLHFSQYLTEDGLSLDGKLLFWGSYPVLMEVCKIDPRNPKTFAQSITLFSLLNLLVKVPQEQIPQKLLTKAKAIAAQHNFQRLTNFYTFEEYGIATLHEGEQIAKNLKDNNLTLAGLSREYVLRTFGKDVADRVYPQFRNENASGTSEKSNMLSLNLTLRLLDQIKSKGFCFEKELTNNYVEYAQWKRSIQETLNSYGLKKVKLNKALKEKFNIDCEGYSAIIISADNLSDNRKAKAIAS